MDFPDFIDKERLKEKSLERTMRDALEGLSQLTLSAGSGKSSGNCKIISIDKPDTRPGGRYGR